MNQPTKDALREQLALAADEIIRLRKRLTDGNDRIDAANEIIDRVHKFMAAHEAEPHRWWHRFAWWRA